MDAWHMVEKFRAEIVDSSSDDESDRSAQTLATTASMIHEFTSNPAQPGSEGAPKTYRATEWQGRPAQGLLPPHQSDLPGKKIRHHRMSRDMFLVILRASGTTTPTSNAGPMQQAHARQSSRVSYEINGNAYDKPYYLADGIYPDWATLVKTVRTPNSEKTRRFAKIQEACRKDVERGFGVLQARWAIVRHPARTWSPKTMHEVMTCCVISMIVENEHPDGRNENHWEFQDMASSINFNQFLEKEKLKSNGSNFTDWFRHVRIFLNGGNLQYVLDAPLGDPPAETETDEVKNVYMTRKTRYSQVQCAILCSLESDLQKRFEHHDPHELIKELKTIFETHAAVECYEASKHFFSCMMEEGSSISEHMLVMTGHAKKLSDLGINMNKEFPELFGMLKAAEIEIKKEHQVLMVNKTTSFKKQGKSKGKNKKSGKKAATPPVKPKSGPKPDAECYYCKEKGHWKRNCSKYLADPKSGLVKKKKEELVVTSYTDASWNTDPDDSKSQSGYVFILNGAAVRQAQAGTVAKSSTESEYIAASEASSKRYG
ncbi:hypothetical protein QYE76_061955 [Lolium multiflorum]|uniref:CCHC-type domain-containing protein n=1 Tax=Lolium multiflorum TaxID=4521 RepID=A0AAD8W6T5_LOLMU|nr:hypothetical protein QYE76_061955 [Lolium multiflorum]